MLYCIVKNEISIEKRENVALRPMYKNNMCIRALDVRELMSSAFAMCYKNCVCVFF